MNSSTFECLTVSEAIRVDLRVPENCMCKRSLTLAWRHRPSTNRLTHWNGPLIERRICMHQLNIQSPYWITSASSRDPRSVRRDANRETKRNSAASGAEHLECPNELSVQNKKSGSQMTFRLGICTQNEKNKIKINLIKKVGAFR